MFLSGKVSLEDGITWKSHTNVSRILALWTIITSELAIFQTFRVFTFMFISFKIC